jgi:type I restriction enzyme S subunit
MNIIYSLNDNGICAVIVPDGELIYSKSLFNMRKYIINNCKMLKIISIESKAFEYTSIKTNVLIFKKQKGEDNYKNVEFLEINKDCNQVKLIAVADLDKYYTFKLETNNNDIIDYELNKDIEIKTLGEVCIFKNGTSITKDKLIKGHYPVIGGGQKPLGYHNEYNVIENTIIISKDGAYAGYISKYNSKIFVSNHGIYIDTINDIILKDYIYYYLKSIQNKIYTLQFGAGQPGIKKEQLELLEILIPSIDKQEKIVKYLDELDNINLLFEYSNNKLFELLLNKSDIYDRIELFNNIENTNIDINNNINKLNELNNYKLKIVKYNPTTEIKSLNEVCNISYGTRIVKKDCENGEYPVYGSGRAMFYTNTFNREGYNILIGRFALSLECVRIINDKIFLNDSGLSVKSKISILLDKYLGNYLLSNKKNIYDLTNGAAQKNLNIEEFNLIKIPIPSLEVQNDIIEYCDNNLEIINNLKKTIENNKKMMKELF